MKIERKRLLPCLCLAFLAVTFLAIPVNAKAPEEPILVGHISHIEGKLFRYVPADEATEPDWVLIRKDAPLGPPDILYSDSSSRAEFIFPNNTSVRIDASTQIDVVAIENELSELYVTAGTGRFYNKSAATAPVTIKAETPFGYVVAPAKTTFDLRVGDDAIELTVLRGTVAFIHVAYGKEQRFEVSAHSFSLRADDRSVATHTWEVDDDWNGWNRRRDALWAQRARVKVEHLPPVLDTYGYVFDRHGIWERIYYDGAYRFGWRPQVAVGWSPFRHGRWTVWFGSHVWIPFEPFGYVTHHYGHWRLIGGRWYWAPPRHRNHRGGHHGRRWHPGRVGWIQSGAHIGWFPLAPSEIYYGHRRWGSHTRVNPKRVDHKGKRHAYVDSAIVVKKSKFYVVKEGGYTPARNSRTLIKGGRSIPMIDRTIVKVTKDRHRYTGVKYDRKPHKTVTTQIKHRKARVRPESPFSAPELKQKLRRIRKGTLRKGSIHAPVVTDRIVTVPDADKPDVTFRVVKPRRQNVKRIPKPSPGKTSSVGKARQDREDPRKHKTGAAEKRIEKTRKTPKQIIPPSGEKKKYGKEKTIRKPPPRKAGTTPPVVKETSRKEKAGKKREGVGPKKQEEKEGEQKTKERPVKKQKRRVLD